MKSRTNDGFHLILPLVTSFGVACATPTQAPPIAAPRATAPEPPEAAPTKPATDSAARGSAREPRRDPVAEVATLLSADTTSPTPAATADAWTPLRKLCGVADGRIDAAAKTLAEAHAHGESTDGRSATNALRDAGEPHVWPRSGVISAICEGDGCAPFDLAAATAKLEPYFRSLKPGVGVRRCGIGEGRDAAGTVHLAVIVVDAAAELSPIPRRGRTGQWITVDATAAPGTSLREGKVVVVGPDHRPRSVPTSTDGKTIKARFALDRPGAFEVQVLSTGDEGPRPILEAHLFADVPPVSAATTAAYAPGETAEIPEGTEPPRALALMVDGARHSLDPNAKPLRWDPELAKVAEAHVAAMRAKGVLAHDVGDGDPAARLTRAGVTYRYAGENVVRLDPPPGAQGGTKPLQDRIALAHRRLWESPSHRGNMLGGNYTRIGTALLVTEDGTLWGAEVFASE